jgi:hypothetical protein
MTMVIRLVPIATAVFLAVVSGPAYARFGVGTAGGAGWSQPAADGAARAYAAEGKCYPINGPCPAPHQTLTPRILKHRYRTR